MVEECLRILKRFSSSLLFIILCVFEIKIKSKIQRVINNRIDFGDYCSFALNNRIRFRHHCSFEINKRIDFRHHCSFAIKNRIDLIFERNGRDICRDKDENSKWREQQQIENNNIETCTQEASCNKILKINTIILKIILIDFKIPLQEQI